MKILALDLATNAGWAFGSHELGLEASGIFSCKTQSLVYTSVSELIKLYKPKLIFSAKPTARYAVIKKQSEIAGVVKYLCEKYGIIFSDKHVDSQIKKHVLGNGRASKDEICKHFGVKDDNQADAILMLTYAIQKL